MARCADGEGKEKSARAWTRINMRANEISQTCRFKNALADFLHDIEEYGMEMEIPKEIDAWWIAYTEESPAAQNKKVRCQACGDDGCMDDVEVSTADMLMGKNYASLPK